MAVAKKVGVVSLGCSKNRVDSELMMGYLERAGYGITNAPEDADVLVVNTCGFIDSAKEEAIEAIFDMLAYKESGSCDVVAVTGCLSERYRAELPIEIPEVDVWLGVDEYERLPMLLDRCFGRESGVAKPYPWGERVISTPAHYAYLRIADGCDNKCSYCAIPGIRGPYASRSMQEVVDEAKRLAERGAKELYVIAQDTTRYGTDTHGKRLLPELLRKLSGTDAEWLRLMYAYPDELDDELIDAMCALPKVLKYVDLPLQHADDGVLAAMNRRGTRAHYAALIDEFRKRDPAYILRTTYMVGFPGETEKRFLNLCDFVREHPFDRVGVFTYSPEDGTPSAELEDDVPPEEKQRRACELMRIQSEVSKELNERRVGTVCKALVDGYDRRSRSAVARTYGEAAEVDGCLYFEPAGPHASGDMVNVRITEALEYDMRGEEVSE